MTVPKLSLNLNEENELAFKISIEGSSTDIGATKPKFRLLVSESENGHGMVYPAEQNEDGSVVVRLPSTETFLEETNYRGKLEVILGNHYFVPTEVDIEFIRPLKVEAVVITNKGNSLREEKAKQEASEPSVSVSTVEVRNKKKIQEALKPQPKPISKPRKRTWADLSESEKKKVIAYRKEQKLKKLRQQKLQEQKKAQAKKLAEQKAEQKLKEQLKDLMSSSLED